METFRYHTDILARYPSLASGIIVSSDVVNGPTPPALQQRYQAEQQAVLQRIGNTPLSQIPSLAAWHNAFRSFGVDPMQYRSAAEALLRRLTKKGDIPGINMLVDIGNLISIRYALPVAVFDIRTLQLPVTVHFADGTERYTTLGQDTIEHPDTGEVVFTDETGLVIARRWCWRQSEQSAAQLDTTHVLITIEAHHNEGAHDVQAAQSDMLSLLREYTTGHFIQGIERMAI